MWGCGEGGCVEPPGGARAAEGVGITRPVRPRNRKTQPGIQVGGPGQRHRSPDWCRARAAISHMRNGTSVWRAPAVTAVRQATGTPRSCGLGIPQFGQAVHRSLRKKRYQCGSRQSPRLLFLGYYNPPLRMRRAIPDPHSRRAVQRRAAQLLARRDAQVSIIPPRGRQVAAVLRDRAGTDQSTARSAFHGLRSGKGGCAVSASRRDRDSGPG